MPDIIEIIDGPDTILPAELSKVRVMDLGNGKWAVYDPNKPKPAYDGQGLSGLLQKYAPR